MPTFDQLSDYKEGLAGSRHVLLMGGSKMGKTDWIAQAANDGYEILYFDNDNARVTLAATLTPAAQKRVHYFAPDSESLGDLMELFIDTAMIRYNFRTNEVYVANSAKPDDKIAELWPARIPRNVIVSFDSWTSVAWSLLRQKAAKMQVDLADIDKWGREIYGNAGFRATNILKHLQLAPFHWVIHGHPVMLEIKEKPPGVVGDIKEKDMIIRKTIEVPMSTSNVHGESLAKYCNEIGYLSLNAAGKPVLDWRVTRGRISGGSLNSFGDPRVDQRWSVLFGKPQPVVEGALPWIRYYTHADLELERKAKAAAAPRLGGATKPSLAAPTVSQGALKPTAAIAQQEGAKK